MGQVKSYYPGFFLASRGKPAVPLDVNEAVSIMLHETETIWIFDLPSISTTADIPEEYQAVKLQNARYSKVCRCFFSFNSMLDYCRQGV